MDVKITKYTIKSPKIVQELSLVFVSDLHECENEDVIEKINSLSPDALLIGGDLVHEKRACSRGFEFLKKESFLRVLCSIGNHDLSVLGKIKNTANKCGAVILDNEFIEFKGIFIGGLTSGGGSCGRFGRLAKTPEPKHKWLKNFEKADGFKLLLSHHPEYYKEYIASNDIDLTLSGHAHGGQWRFFGRGVFSPGQGLFPKYTSGMYEGGKLIVSRGLGNPHSIPRINNKPEIILINLVNSRL